MPGPSEQLIFRRPPSASLAAVGEPYSSAVGLLMEDPKSPPEKGGPGAGDAAGRLKDKRRSRAGLPKMVRRKHLEPGPNLSSFAIPVRMTPLSLLLVRRIWLFTANAFERWHEAAYFFYVHGEDEHEGSCIFEGALRSPQLPRARGLCTLAPPPYRLTHAPDSSCHPPPPRGRAGENDIIESGSEAGHHPLLGLELRSFARHDFARVLGREEQGRGARGRRRHRPRGIGRQERARTVWCGVWGIGSRQDDAGPTRVCHELSVEPLSSV